MPGDWRDKARADAKRKKQGSRFKLVEGENAFRVLPNAKGTDSPPYYEYRIHRDVGPDRKLVRCGKDIDTNDGHCWLCDEIIPRLEKSGKRAKIAQSKALSPKDQFVVQVATIDSESGKMEGPLVWYVPTGGPKSMSVSLLGVLASPRRRYDDPKNGYNLYCTRTGTGMTDTRYSPLEPADEPSKVPSNIVSAILPFTKVINGYDEDEQRAAYYGRSVDEMKSSLYDDEDKEGANMAKKAKKVSKSDEKELKRKKGRKAEDEDEEDEDLETEDEVEDDDEDEKPSKKKSKKVPPKKSKKSKDEDDEDEDDEDEDDEDDAPKSKKSKKAPPAKSKKAPAAKPQKKGAKRR